MEAGFGGSTSTARHSGLSANRIRVAKNAVQLDAFIRRALALKCVHVEEIHPGPSARKYVKVRVRAKLLRCDGCRVDVLIKAAP